MNHRHTTESLIAFEEKVKSWWEAGELPSLVHLCGGNEEQLLEIFANIGEQDWVFASHRAHYHALLKGIPEAKVEQFIRDDSSMFMFSKEHRFYQSAILAGCCPIAVGVAQAIKDAGGKEWVHCFLGEGAEEEGAFYEAVLYASTHRLPVSFVIEDNGFQVDTPVKIRRPNRIEYFEKDLPRFPINWRGNVVRFTANPVWPSCVHRYHYERQFPHAGSGSKHHITFKRLHPL